MVTKNDVIIFIADRILWDVFFILLVTNFASIFSSKSFLKKLNKDINICIIKAMDITNDIARTAYMITLNSKYPKYTYNQVIIVVYVIRSIKQYKDILKEILSFLLLLIGSIINHTEKHIADATEQK